MGTALQQDDYRPEIIPIWNDLTDEYPEIPEAYHDMDDAVQEVRELSTDIESELESRRDLRDLSTVTIDPDYAHDHDDAVSLQKKEDGYKAHVHIADVGHYVDPGSAIDEEAEDRAVTFYLGDNTRHMLPPELAQDICSLAPGEEKLAHTVEMDLTEEGEVEAFDIYKSVIESDAHLTHSESERIIESSDVIFDWYEEDNTLHEFAVTLDGLDKVTENMRENNWTDRLYMNKRNTGERIIEEMMVAANESVGDYLREQDVGIYRVEEAPDKDWEQEVQADLLELNYDLELDATEENPIPVINDFFEETVAEEDEEEVIKAVKTKLPRAKWSASSGSFPAGHFGLGSTDYAHFTSPIRRYVDLINHWIISGEIEDVDTENIDVIAEHASEQDKAAEDAAMAWPGANT